MKRIWIVNQDMEIPGGCLPDLPDSAYPTLEEARKRVTEGWFNYYSYVKEQFPGFKIECNLDPDSAEMFVDRGYIYFHIYVVGSIPLCDTVEEFNNLPNPNDNG